MRRIAIVAALMLCTTVLADEPPIPVPVPDPISTPCAEELANYESAIDAHNVAGLVLNMAVELLSMAQYDLAECQANGGGNCSDEQDSVDEWQAIVAAATTELALIATQLQIAEDAYVECCGEHGLDGPGGTSSLLLTALVAMPFLN